jgi:hypothetical protein
MEWALDERCRGCAADFGAIGDGVASYSRCIADNYSVVGMPSWRIFL